MIEEQQRETWIDIAKGIAILMVVLGHAIRDDMRINNGVLDYIYRCCYIFHMSFFMFLSGYTYQLGYKKNCNRQNHFIKKKICRLIFPWILYTLFIYIVFSMVILIKPIKETLMSAGYYAISFGEYWLQSLQANNPWAFHLWFIFVLFFITAIVYLIDKHTGKYAPWCFGTVIFICLLMKWIGLSPFGNWSKVANYIILYLPFYIFGKLFCMFKDRITIVNKKVIFCLSLLGALYICIRAKWFSGFAGNTVVAETKILQMIIYYLSYFLLPCVMIEMYFLLIKTERNFETLQLLGRESFYIYLFHQPFFGAFLGMVLYGKLKLPALLSLVVSMLCSVVIPIILHKFITFMQIGIRNKMETYGYFARN